MALALANDLMALATPPATPKAANFRLIVSGQVGAKEIERLVKKLELDNEILAEQDADEADEAAN